MHLTSAIRNAQFSVTWITVAQFTVAHLTIADFTNPTKKLLLNLPLPNFLVAQFSVAQFTVYTYSTMKTIDTKALGRQS